MDSALHIRDWVSVGMFGLAIMGAIATYFKTMSNMRHETQIQFSAFQKEITEFGKELREEIRSQYATKEETRFQHETLLDIKDQLKYLNAKLEAKRLV